MHNNFDLNSDQYDTAISSTDKRERARLTALERLDAMRPEADSILQEIVDDVCKIFGTDLCMINLLTADMQYFRAWSGDLAEDLAEARQGSRKNSMCQYVVDTETPLVVEDFLATEKFREQHLWVRYGIRFYAGTPLIVSDGHTIGTLCVLSARASEFGEERMKVLKAFARAVVSRLELLGALSHERAGRQQLLKQSEELRSQRNLYRSLLGASGELGEGLVILEDERIIDVNQAFSEISGYSVESLTAMPSFLDLVCPEDRAMISERLHQIMESSETNGQWEMVLLAKGGERIDLEFGLSAVRMDGHSRLVAIARDITARKRTEMELRYLLDLTRTITDSLHSGLVGVDREDRITFANSAAQQILGWARSELVGERIHDLIYRRPNNGDCGSAEGCQLLEAISSDTVFRVSNDTFTRKDGSTFSAAYTTAPIFKNEQHTGSVISFRDITARKLAEETQSQLAAIVNSSDDAIIGKTLDGMITSWNSGAERLYGYSAEEVVGRSISVIVPADRSGEVPDILTHIRRKESITHDETERIRKDGSRVDVSITVSPIITPAGDVVGASAITRDISEKKQLQATKDSFISTVSHELRTPLTSIRGYLEALIEDEGGPLNAEQQEYADIAYRNTGRLQKIVEDLLLLPRLDLGQLELNSAVINVGGVLRQVEQEFSLVAQEKNIALLIRAESDLVIIGDRFRIAQVMSNLVGNALKFTPSGRRVSVSASRWHDEVIVEVVDEGVGIPAAELPRLTERFFRASTAGSVQGTGLGLAITKDIIERHRGKLEIESEEGVGSTFRVVLPEASQGQSRV